MAGDDGNVLSAAAMDSGVHSRGVAGADVLSCVALSSRARAAVLGDGDLQGSSRGDQALGGGLRDRVRDDLAGEGRPSRSCT